MTPKTPLIILISLSIATSSSLHVGANFQDPRECYIDWREAIVLLKERAVESVELSFMAEQTLINNIGLTSYDKYNHKLTLTGNRTTLTDLNQKIDSVSGLLLENKRNSDLLTLAAEEFKETRQTVEQLRSQFESTIVLSKPLEFIQTKSGELDKMIQSFKHDLVDVQQSTWLGAQRLIEQSKLRSQLSSLEANKELRYVFDISKALISKMRPKIEGIRYRHRQMEVIAEKILNSMQHSPKKAEPADLELQSYKEKAIEMRKSVASMIDEADLQMGRTHMATENRESNPKSSIDSLDEQASHIEIKNRHLIDIALELSNRTGNEQLGISANSLAQWRLELFRRQSQLRDITMESLKLFDMTKQRILTTRMDAYSMFDSIKSILMDTCEYDNV